MNINIEKVDSCWEIRFHDPKTLLGIVIEDDHAYVVWVHEKFEDVKSMSMPPEFLDMIKDEYKIKRPEIKIDMEEIEALPWE